LERAGYQVQVVGDGAAALAALGRSAPDVLVSDLVMPVLDGMDLLRAVKERSPETAIVLVTAHGDIANAVQAIRAGAYDYLTKPFEPERLVHTVAQALTHRNLVLRTAELQRQLAQQTATEPIIGMDPSMVTLRSRIATVAASDANVLIAGETGTGKELVAKALHAASSRANKPFVAVNCAALPEGLFASELFGHERGSFTSAVQTRVGRLESAEGGSLFLDEIGDLPLSVQGSLLRVLQERCFERIGSSRRVVMDARIIAATKRNLQHEVRAGGFREDLFFRLDVVHLVCPPLRERRGDILLLVDHFLQRHAARGGPPMRISPASIRKLLGYSWPGNVRELENVLARATLLSRNRTLEPADLDLAMDSANGKVPPLALAAMEQQHIAHVLDLCGWNRSETARALGVDRGTLHRKIAQFGLRPKPDPGIR
jgi:DNA-binding NtrC family response regulator